MLYCNLAFVPLLDCLARGSKDINTVQPLAGRDYRRALQEAELLGKFVRLADNVLVAALAAQVMLPVSVRLCSHVHFESVHVCKAGAKKAMRP